MWHTSRYKWTNDLTLNSLDRWLKNKCLSECNNLLRVYMYFACICVSACMHTCFFNYGQVLITSSYRERGVPVLPVICIKFLIKIPDGLHFFVCSHHRVCVHTYIHTFTCFIVSCFVHKYTQCFCYASKTK